MRGAASSVLLFMGACGWLAAVGQAYFMPDFTGYMSQRHKEIVATRRAAKESVACKAKDILSDFPEVQVDVRLAGWRVNKGGSKAGGQRGEEPQGQGLDGITAAEEEVEEPVLVDTHSASLACVVGDVVEYTLPDHARLLSSEEDARTKGVGVLLSINRDRLDAGSLPEEKLDLCQVDPLTIDPEAESDDGSVAWKKDELEPRAFVSYAQLKKVRARHNGKGDKWKRWVLEEELTPGCGPPPGAEEVLMML